MKIKIREIAKKNKGYSLYKLAKELKLPQQTVYSWANGRTQPSYENMDRPECSANYVDKNAPLDDMTVFIQSGKPLHDDVVEQMQKKSLDKQMDRINNDMAPDSQNYKYLNDASDAVKAQPTDAEIANAVRVLAKVGFNPLNNMMNGYSDPQMSALSAMLGNSNNNNNMNYLPYMLSQGSANPDAAKQMIQNMMMSQMMF